MQFGFQLLHRDANCLARRATLSTPHGPVQLPAFMPVGTQATVKGMAVDRIEATGSQMVLGNTYHLTLRPGHERIERFSWSDQEGTDTSTILNSRTEGIEQALASLPPRDAKVLRLYFGLDDGNSRTLEEIGRMMGVTRERIRQLRDRALLRLREGETGDRLKDLVA